MQRMQGNMRSFGMGGQQFRQFFAAGTRSSLLGPVPMGVAIKSPMRGFPAARPVYPHVRYFNNNTSVPGTSSSTSTSTTDAARQSDRKRDSEQITPESTDDQPGPSTATEASDAIEAGNVVDDAGGSNTFSVEQLEEPVIKKQRTQGSEEPIDQAVVCVADGLGLDIPSEILCSESDSQPGEGGSTVGSEVLESEEEGTAAEVQECLSVPVEDQQVNVPSVEMPQEKNNLPLTENQEEEEEGVGEGTNKFYCYLCSITCHNQQNFRSHMNSMSHQQRMMEIQHMSNACLVTLLPRLQDSFQGTNKDEEKKAELKRWCATCQTHFTSSIMDHRLTQEHKFARKTAISSCRICKKHFRTSQFFVEHLQTHEHRKKVEMLQENEGCAGLSKVTVMDEDGFLVEEEGSELEEDEARLSDAGDQDVSDKPDGGTSREVTMEDMNDSEQYDPETVYGSSFFVPVAGFICRLCNKFYHFESSALHLHCKSLKHFENLKRYKTGVNCEQKGEADDCNRSAAQDSISPETEANTDCSNLTSDSNSKQAVISLCRLQKDPKEHEKQVEPNKTTPHSTNAASSTSCTDQQLPSGEEETPGDQDSAAILPADTRDSDQTSVDGNEEKGDPGKNIPNPSKAKPTPRRRTVRTTNRR